jgi:transposase InsO family protein
MREDNLLCLRRKAFVRTTNSDHKLPVYPNLTKELKVNGLNQLWVADITYIRLQCEFVYLSVILDAHSRRVIGWALGRRLEADLAVEALKMAIGRGRLKALDWRCATGDLIKLRLEIRPLFEGKPRYQLRPA